MARTKQTGHRLVGYTDKEFQELCDSDHFNIRIPKKKRKQSPNKKKIVRDISEGKRKKAKKEFVLKRNINNCSLHKVPVKLFEATEKGEVNGERVYVCKFLLCMNQWKNIKKTKQFGPVILKYGGTRRK